MVNLGFNGNLNTSVGIGDNVYRVETSTVGENTDNSTEFTVATISEPSVANPAAKVTACCSAIPTSNILLGNFFEKISKF